ncbi:MAG: hypothetical protein MUQ56_12255, partial [Thermoleophilia bacterium]|nr:hypothetical protein [Thermoleophilia bacterium]
DLLRRRLGLLSAGARHLLEHASILGLEVDEAVLRRLGEPPSEEFDRVLAEAEAARLLVRSPEGSVRFNHALLRAAVLADLEPGRRTRLHLRAAEVLEEVLEAGTQPGERIGTAEIAYHLAEALPLGDPAKAASYALQAGEEAAAHFAWEEAMRQCERGMHICEVYDACPLDLAPALAADLGDALVALSRRTEGVAAYERAAAAVDGTASSGGDQRDRLDRLMVAGIHHRIALAQLADRRFEEASSAFDRALSQLPDEPRDRDREDWELWMAVQLSRAEAFYHAGLLEELRLLLETLDPLAEAHATPRQQADLLATRTMFVLRRDRYRPGPEGVTTASAELASRVAGDPGGSGLAGAYFRLGFVRLLRDEFVDARTGLDAAARTAREIGDRVREAQAHVYLSRLDRRLGLVQATRLSARRAYESATKAGLPGYAAAAQSDLAWVLLREGHTFEAREQAAQALKAWGPDSTWPFEWLARFPLTAVAYSKGSFDEVGDHLRAMLRPTQEILPDPLTAAMERALVALGAGDDAVAGTIDAVAGDVAAPGAIDAVLAEAQAGNYA